MGKALSHAVAFIFAVLAVWHFYLAFVPSASGHSGAVPSAEGKPLFVPTRRATAAVGVVVLLFAALVLATAGTISLGVPQSALSWLSYALALGLVGRAMGEFRYVGFFKRVRDTKFAWLDTYVYSPLCLLLAVGVTLVALQHGSDIDYRKCAVVILTDQIKQLGHRDRLSVYVSINGEDPDQATLDALRPLAASIRPGSYMPHLPPGVTVSDHLQYDVSSINRGIADQYTAMVGFYCGSLCGARIEYQLKKHEDSCTVTGQRILVQM